ncbi:MAG TPA: hypothetical protein VN901_25625 [Candidatus Acidoferrales bacterium]|nr:hypothetical protein [Candidatus Acidoferrales bacterium]
MASRKRSQALADGIRLGFSTSKPVASTPNPVVTTLALAGFAFSLAERFSGLGLIVGSGFAASDPAAANPDPSRLQMAPAVFRRAAARCAAVAIRVAPGQSLVVFSCFAQDVAHIDEG